MTQLKMLSADDKLAEIRRLYFNTTKQTIQQDLARALDLLKTMATEEERERATVYMEGLAEMRNDWVRERTGGGSSGRPKPGAKTRQGKSANRAAKGQSPKPPRKP